MVYVILCEYKCVLCKKAMRFTHRLVRRVAAQ